MSQDELNKLIDRATLAAGSQKALADRIGVAPQAISNFKKGRPCGFRKQAQMAAIAGEDPLPILMQGFADSMDAHIPHEAAAKDTLQAILKAFPQT